MKPVEELKQKFAAFKELPFPQNSINDELSDIFAELIQYDGHVAGLVTTFLAGKPIRRELVWVDRVIDQQLKDVHPKDGRDYETISQYQLYKSRLDELVELLKQCFD